MWICTHIWLTAEARISGKYGSIPVEYEMNTLDVISEMVLGAPAGRQDPRAAVLPLTAAQIRLVCDELATAPSAE
jgi:hypothetical protein